MCVDLGLALEVALQSLGVAKVGEDLEGDLGLVGPTLLDVGDLEDPPACGVLVPLKVLEKLI